MKWLDKLERKFGRYAIHNLMLYVVILYAVGFVLQYLPGNFYENYLSLDVNMVFKGQVWRLITFIIQPPSTSPLFVLLVLYFYYIIGRQLEMAWGAFRFNVYYFTGILFHIIAAVLAYVILSFLGKSVVDVFGGAFAMGTTYLNLSLYFAYATMYPDHKVYILMFIPMKVKWLAIADAVLFAIPIIAAFLPGAGILLRTSALEAIVSILNFVIFFFATRQMRRFSPKEIKRKKKYKNEIKKAREHVQYANGAKHKCAVCGRTELDDETLEFRYCSKCNGNYEYCQDHLFTHEHVK